MLTKTSEDFPDLYMVSSLIGRVDKNVIQVYHDANIQHIVENVIHEALESARGIQETKRHYQPLKRAVFSVEGSFPLVTITNSDEMIGMLQIYFRINSCLT